MFIKYLIKTRHSSRYISAQNKRNNIKKLQSAYFGEQGMEMDNN